MTPVSHKRHVQVSRVTLCVSLATLATGSDPCTNRFSANQLGNVEVAEIEGWPLEPETEYTVASIRIIRQQIFNTDDAAEDRLLFRLANRWHVNTREDTIRTLLLFGDGDKVDLSRLAETERALRAKRFLYDARVIANRVCGNDVDIVVVTRDIWSLHPTTSVTRTGGENEYDLGFSERNIFGTGVEVDAELFKTLDRSGASAGFTNPNLGNSRVGLGVRVENTDEGDGVLAFIGPAVLCAGYPSRLEPHRDHLGDPAPSVRRRRRDRFVRARLSPRRPVAGLVEGTGGRVHEPPQPGPHLGGVGFQGRPRVVAGP